MSHRKGFSSVSYLHQAAEHIGGTGKATHIYVLSDFHPSGKCSLDAIEPGLRRHLGDEAEIHVYDLAVTPDQIRGWELPTRETKVQGNNHWRKFHGTYGDTTYLSCELDAIRPDMLRGLVADAIRRHWPHAWTLEDIKAEEQAERAEIKKIRVR